MTEHAPDAATWTAQLAEPTLWVAVSFLLFFALFGKKLFGAMNKALDNRATRIAAELEEAKRLRQEAENALAAYRRKHAESLKEAGAILTQARENADRMAMQAQKELKSLTETRLRMAEEKIAQAEQQAITEVRDHIIDLTTAAARALILESIEQMPADEMMRRAIADLERKVH